MQRAPTPWQTPWQHVAALAGVGELSAAEARTRAHRRRRALRRSDLRCFRRRSRTTGCATGCAIARSNDKVHAKSGLTPVLARPRGVHSAPVALVDLRVWSDRFARTMRLRSACRPTIQGKPSFHTSQHQSHVLGARFCASIRPHPLSHRHTCTTHSNELLLSAMQRHWATSGCHLHRDTEHQGTHKPSFNRRHR